MDANEIINLIKTSKKKTPVKAYIKAKNALNLEKFNFYGNKDMYIVFGELVEVEKFIKDNHPPGASRRPLPAAYLSRSR